MGPHKKYSSFQFKSSESKQAYKISKFKIHSPSNGNDIGI